jgi:hypothetical protein
MLRTFRQLTKTYFIYTHFTNMGRLVEQHEAVEAREQINLRIGNVLESCALIGHTMSMNYTPPPATRLAGFTINVIKDMFQFDRLRIPRRVVFDYLDRAIGDYERLLKKLVRLSFNPLYWLWMGFATVLSLPFRILGAAGFNARAMERSWAGKLFKLIEAIAALLAVLNYLGFSTTWQRITSLFQHR